MDESIGEEKGGVIVQAIAHGNTGTRGKVKKEEEEERTERKLKKSRTSNTMMMYGQIRRNMD